MCGYLLNRSSNAVVLLIATLADLGFKIAKLIRRHADLMLFVLPSSLQKRLVPCVSDCDDLQRALNMVAVRNCDLAAIDLGNQQSTGVRVQIADVGCFWTLSDFEITNDVQFRPD